MTRRARVSRELPADEIPPAADVEPRTFDRDLTDNLPAPRGDRLGYAPPSFAGLKTHCGPLALKKQISVQFPLADWKLLRLEAATRRISITGLVRQSVEPLLATLRPAAKPTGGTA